MGLAAPWIRHSRGLTLVLGLTFIGQAFFGSCWGTLVDAVAVIGTGAAGSGGYGRLRLWAAVGWGTCAVLSGWLIDVTTISSIFVTFAAGMAVSIMLVVIFFSDPKRLGPPEEKGEEAAVERGTGQELRAILGRAEVVLLLLNLFMQGVLVAFVESFLYVYLDEVYRCTGFFLGLCTFVAAVFELPVFYYAEAIIRRFGVKAVLTFAQFLYATRVFLYTVIPRGTVSVCAGGGCKIDGYWLFLLLEPSHAFVFAAMWSAAVEYSRVLAPERHQGTMQALTRGVYYFVGNGVGSILGGILIDSKGGGGGESDDHDSDVVGSDDGGGSGSGGGGGDDDDDDETHTQGFRFMYRFGAVAMVCWSLTWHLLMAASRRAGCESQLGRDSSTAPSEVPTRGGLVNRNGEGSGPTPAGQINGTGIFAASSPLLDGETIERGEGHDKRSDLTAERRYNPR